MNDRISAELRRYEAQCDAADERYEMFVRPMLKRAKAECVDELMSGAKIEDLHLPDILDGVVQTDRYKEFLCLTAKVVSAGYSAKPDELQEAVYNLRLFTERRVEQYLTDDMIEERAQELADER